MAIILITGLPGHGKTLYALKRVQEQATRDKRPVFHNGITGLVLPWTLHEPEQWRELAPGSIFVLDECQACFPVRGRGQPPEWIEELAKHRHRGVDFYIITQNPMLIDSFVRRLVDQHFHLVRKFGTQFATVHEFTNGVKESVAVSREGSITHEWRYPSEVFNWYKSAELHTVKRRIPARVFVLASIPLILIGLSAYIWHRLSPESQAAAALQAAGPAASAPARASVATGTPAPAAAVLTVADYLAAQAPRVPGLAHTAPVYDGVTAPVQAPYPAACVSSATRCGCYSQQGTRLDMPQELCRSIAAGGFFVSWVQPPPPTQAASAPPSASPSRPSEVVFAGPVGIRGERTAKPESVERTAKPDSGERGTRSGNI